MWADGVHPKVRLGQAHSCVLVLLGVRLDGTKELIALAEGLRESTESWADLLRDCRRRGMHDPELVVGDGAMGLWKALSEVFPAARHQRCCVHKARNVTNALPKSAQPGATKAMQEIYNAEDRGHAEKAIDTFAKTYGAKFPKAVAKIADDQEELLAFYDFPAEHWIHLRTTNPIESTFSTGSPAAALAMVFKLVESAQARWRAITGAHLVALVRAGARFENGVLVERRDQAACAPTTPHRKSRPSPYVSLPTFASSCRSPALKRRFWSRRSSPIQTRPWPSLLCCGTWTAGPPPSASAPSSDRGPSVPSRIIV